MAVRKSVEETKGKSVYMAGCAIILHYFVLEYIPDYGTDSISVVSPRMLSPNSRA